MRSLLFLTSYKRQLFNSAIKSPESMKNLLLKIEYLGKNYSGWQIQPNATTVEGVIKEVFEKICQTEIILKACSRTDAGVHADCQIASVIVPDSINLNRFFISVNSLLPDDISIFDLIEVPLDYSVRHENRSKRYHYRILRAPVTRLFELERSIWLRNEIDMRLVKEAANKFVGKKDFSAFRGKGCQQPNPEKLIACFDVHTTEHKDFQVHHLVVEGSGFLKNMVRIMAGTLIDIGQKRLPVGCIEKALKTGDRNDAGGTAPAKGLTLEKIEFETDPFKIREMGSWEC